MNVTLECPLCGVDRDHEILKESGEVLVRCNTCGHIHRVTWEQKPLLKVRVVVSSGERSMVCSTEMETEEEVTLGDVITAECDGEAYGVEITGIEKGEQRVKRARGSEIRTLWTRAIEQVVVRVSIHSGRTTTPLYLTSEGTREYEVGERYRAGKGWFRISHIKLRNGRFMRRKGERAVAMSIKRVYAFRL